MTQLVAVGVWFYSISTDRCMYLMRNDRRYSGHWALPGGKVEKGEALIDSIHRECKEELGTMPDVIKLIPVEKFTAEKNHFTYHTFFCLINEEFIPVLNHEHVGYAWINSGTIPKPLHPGFWNTLKADEVHSKIKTLTELYISL